MAQKLRAFSEVPPEEFDGVLANARSCADVIALSTIAGAMDPRVDNHLGYVREFSDRAFGRPTQAHEAPSEHRVKSERRAGLPSSELRTLEVLLRKHGKFDEANAVAAELAQEDSPDA